MAADRDRSLSFGLLLFWLAAPLLDEVEPNGEPVEVPGIDVVLCNGIEEEIRDIVRQGAADQEFHGEIVNTLGVLALIGALRVQPSLREDVPLDLTERALAYRGVDPEAIRTLGERYGFDRLRERAEDFAGAWESERQIEDTEKGSGG